MEKWIHWCVLCSILISCDHQSKKDQASAKPKREKPATSPVAASEAPVAVANTADPEAKVAASIEVPYSVSVVGFSDTQFRYPLESNRQGTQRFVVGGGSHVTFPIVDAEAFTEMTTLRDIDGSSSDEPAGAIRLTKLQLDIKEANLEFNSGKLALTLKRQPSVLKHLAYYTTVDSLGHPFALTFAPEEGKCHVEYKVSMRPANNQFVRRYPSLPCDFAKGVETQWLEASGTYTGELVDEIHTGRFATDRAKSLVDVEDVTDVKAAITDRGLFFWKIKIFRTRTPREQSSLRHRFRFFESDNEFLEAEGMTELRLRPERSTPELRVYTFSSPDLTRVYELEWEIKNGQAVLRILRHPQLESMDMIVAMATL